MKPTPRFCLYHGKKCEFREEYGDGNCRIVVTSEIFALEDGGWKRVDKFEWEKTVKKTDVEILDNDY